MRLFNKKAAKMVVGIGTILALSGGMVGLIQAQEIGPPQSDIKGTYTLKAEDGTRQATIEIRECGKDMCVYIKQASPVLQEKLGIPANASDYEIVSGLKADGNGGLEDGRLNATGMADGADVEIKDNQMVASKFFKSMKADLEKAPVQVASAKIPSLKM